MVEKDVGNQKQSWKRNMILKAKLTEIMDEEWMTQAEQVADNIETLMTNFLRIDKEIEILPWRSNKVPINNSTKTTDCPRTKKELMDYVQSVWTQKGRNPYIRFHIAHSCKKEEFGPDFPLVRRLKGYNISV